MNPISEPPVGVFASHEERYGETQAALPVADEQQDEFSPSEGEVW